jgi:hypothetical protein
VENFLRDLSISVYSVEMRTVLEMGSGHRKLNLLGSNHLPEKIFT